MFGYSDARSEDLGSGGPTASTHSTGATGPTEPTGPTEATRAAGTATASPGQAARAEPDPVASVPTPPVTGDEAVDEAMTRLASAQAGSFAERIESGEHAHRSLQSRLGGLGGA